MTRLQDNTSNLPPRLSTSLDIEEYPSILALIVNYSSIPTRAKLLQCSKSTFQIASKKLYRNLELRCSQISGMLETSLAYSGARSPSKTTETELSRSLQYCLQQVQSLHILDSDELYINPPNLSNGCLPNVTSVVIHIETFEHDLSVTIPPSFSSIGGADGWDLYILISGEKMDEYDDLDAERLCVALNQPPKSCRSATLMVGDPTKLGAMPMLEFWPEAEKRHDMPLTVVLLPWEREGQYEKYTEYDTRASHEWIDEEDPDFDLEQRRRFIGMECNGLWGIQASLVGHYFRDKAEAEKSKLSFETFLTWIAGLEPDTIFTIEKARELEVKSARLVFNARKFLLARYTKDLKKISAKKPDHASMLKAIREMKEAKEEASDSFKAIMAKQVV